MNILSASNPVWVREDQSMLNLTVEFVELPGEKLLFTASPDDVESHGQELWQRAISGEYGPIAPWVEKENG